MITIRNSFQSQSGPLLIIVKVIEDVTGKQAPFHVTVKTRKTWKALV